MHSRAQSRAAMSVETESDREGAAPSTTTDEVTAWRPRWLMALHEGSYRVTRFVFLRFLGLIYTVAFAVACNQLVPLVGHQGLLPADQFFARVQETLGGEAMMRLPSLFWFGVSDTALAAVSYAGLALALVVLAGFANA